MPQPNNYKLSHGKLVGYRVRKKVVSVICLCILLIWFIISAFPIIWAFWVSIHNPIDVFKMPPNLAAPTTFLYYETILAENYGFYLQNTVIVSVFSVALSLLIGCPCAYALARYGRKTSFTLLAVALVFRALPGMVYIIPYYYISILLGIYDTHLLLILATVAFNQPFTIWILRSFFLTVPSSIDEAAMIDGCSRFKAFIKVILPVMGTGVITSLIFTLLTAYNEYMMASALTATKASTLPVLLAQFSKESTTYWAVSAAGSVLMAVPFIIIVLLLQKRMVQGMSAGAVKG